MPLKPPRPFDGKQVERVFNHAQQLLIARGVATDRAGVLVGIVPAPGAGDHVLAQAGYGGPQRRHLRRGRAQQEEGQALRRLGSDGGQPAKFLNQTRDRPWDRVGHVL